MTTPQLTLDSPDTVETVYYEAFAHCDQQVMAALWAPGEVICIHPGSDVITGYEAVMRSWRHIFNNASPPQFTYTVLKRTRGEDLAVHLVCETIGADAHAARVLATNVYQQFDKGWLMIEHHASLVQTQRQGASLQ